MAADVVERAQGVIAPTQDEYTLAGHRDVQAVAFFRHLLGATNAEPLVVEYPRRLEAKHLLARVEVRGERGLQLTREHAPVFRVHTCLEVSDGGTGPDRRSVEESVQAKCVALPRIGPAVHHVGDEFT